jgi:hypothetical protein
MSGNENPPTNQETFLPVLYNTLTTIMERVQNLAQELQHLETQIREEIPPEFLTKIAGEKRVRNQPDNPEPPAKHSKK